MIPEELQRLFLEHGKEICLNKGDVLFRQGEESQNLYFVLSGSLTVSVSEGKTSPVAINRIEAGELLGELGAITQHPRSATLIAATPVVLSCISTSAFQDLLVQNPSFIEAMTLTNRSRLTSADMARIQFRNIHQQMQKHLARLDKEKEQLQELLRLREEFEALVVHDLRNPLNAVIIALNMLESVEEQVQDKETCRRAISLARNATQRMSRLIDTLLDVARLEAGKLVLNIDEFDLTNLIGDVIETEKTKAAESVEIVRQAQPELKMKADFELIRRVLSNLLDNALKFAPPRSKVEITSESCNDRSIRIKVTDAGPGVPHEERERIFDKFAQVRYEEFENRCGTGLGLTFCRMAVEAHGGSIHVEDGPLGVGSCFIIEIPKE
jgi:signal transduction histidine kinase